MANLQSSTISGNTMWHFGNHGRVINRGNPGQGSALSLTKLGEVHFYSSNGATSLDISTTMVENSIYELYFQYLTNSGSNCDPLLYPNYTAYSGQFASFYWGSPGFNVFNQGSNNGFYTDHYGGGVGNLPCGKYVLFNKRTKKQVLYQGGDTESVCQGGVRWNNSTTVWSNVGRLAGMPTGDIRAWVRRIG